MVLCFHNYEVMFMVVKSKILAAKPLSVKEFLI